MENPRPELIPNPAVKRLSLLPSPARILQAEGPADDLVEAVGGVAQPDRRPGAKRTWRTSGSSGIPGIGYRVDDLIGQVKRILGTDRVGTCCW